MAKNTFVAEVTFRVVESSFLLPILDFSCNKKSNPVSCQEGYYSPEGIMLCTGCTKGYHCPAKNLTSPIPCPVGYYANETKMVQCKICEAGFLCNNATETPIPCAAGKYTPIGTVSQCLDCPAGYR